MSYPLKIQSQALFNINIFNFCRTDIKGTHCTVLKTYC